MIYYLKRKYYAAVRNPYLERRGIVESPGTNREIAENNGTEEASQSTPSQSDSAAKLKVEGNKLVSSEKAKTPVYQNLGKSGIDKVNKATSKDSNRLKNRQINQNININRNTNINNPAREKEAELNAQVRMSKMTQQAQAARNVNEKLIEMQKTEPLKPLSMNS